MATSRTIGLSQVTIKEKCLQDQIRKRNSKQKSLQKAAEGGERFRRYDVVRHTTILFRILINVIIIVIIRWWSLKGYS